MLLRRFNPVSQLVHVDAVVEQVTHGLTHPVHDPVTSFGYNPVGHVVVHRLVVVTK